MRAWRGYAAALPGLALLATGPAGATDIDPYWLGSIPAEYHGSWNSRPNGCRPLAGRYRLRIAANAIEAGGDRFETVNIGWNEGGGIGVVSRYVGPAKSWTRVDFFKLSADGSTLSNDHARRTIVRTRCPA